VAVAWAVPLWLLAYHARTTGVKFWGALACTGAAALATGLTLLLPLAGWRFRHGLLAPVLRVRDWVYLVALLANLVLVYATATYPEYPVRAAAVAMGVAALAAGLIGACVWVFTPRHWRNALRAVRQVLTPLGANERRYFVMGLVYLFALPVVLIGLAICPYLASPVSIILLVLFGAVAVYSIFAYAVRRTLVLAFGVVVLLVCVSHVQRYQMRFEGLPYYSNPLNLAKETSETEESDVTRQRDFENHQRQYGRNARLILAAEENVRVKGAVVAEGTVSDSTGAVQRELERPGRPRQASGSSGVWGRTETAVGPWSRQPRPRRTLVPQARAT
jgi:hypothetical protein